MWKHTYIAYIVKSKQGSKEKDVIILDQDVHVCGYVYMVANIILLCSLKHISLDWNLENTLQGNMGYLIHLFFSLFLGGHLSTHYFQYLRHLSIFFNTFSLNNFCIATCLFSAIETFQERHLQELGAFILTIIFLCLFPI